MKRTAQHDAGDDDDDRRRARNRSPPVRVSSMSGMSQAAAAPDNDNDRRRIPRVIRNAVDGAGERRPGRAGYSPVVVVGMAAAHRWARYDDVVAALRDLTNASLLEEAARAEARATIRRLYQHSPFAVDARFPEAAIFLSVDHGRFGQCMNRIKEEMQCVEAATSGYHSQRLVATCGAFMEAVNCASDTVSLMLPDEPGKPVLYDRDVFEEAFQLTWTDA